MKIISDNPAYESMLAKSEADELKVIGRVLVLDFKIENMPTLYIA